MKNPVFVTPYGPARKPHNKHSSSIRNGCQTCCTTYTRSTYGRAAPGQEDRGKVGMSKRLPLPLVSAAWCFGEPEQGQAPASDPTGRSKDLRDRLCSSRKRCVRDTPYGTRHPSPHPLPIEFKKKSKTVTCNKMSGRRSVLSPAFGEFPFP